ncbi:MAG: RtcB family protein, partial [Solirubrobacteraceae bacterium]
IAYEGHVSPSGVGYDIGCGNKAVCTELTVADLDALGGVGRIMGEITRRISFGVGVAAVERVDDPVLDKISNAEFEPQRKLAQNAANQLGTVGSGNHYVNLMEDEQGRVWGQWATTRSSSRASSPARPRSRCSRRSTEPAG